MIATLLKPETYELLMSMTRLNKHWDIRTLTIRSINDIYKQLDSGDYTILIIDILGINKNVNTALNVIERMSKSSTIQIIVIAQELDRTSPTCRDIISIGIPEEYLITDNDTILKKQLQELLPKVSDIENDITPPEELEQLPAQTENETFMEVSETIPSLVSQTVIPPSTITRVEAKKNLIHKPPVLTPSAIMIAFAGAGRRIGVTTQAMQTILFLKNQDRKVALIEYHGRTALEMYLEITSEKSYVLHDENHFQLYGTDIYRNANAFLKVKNTYDYLVFDYGALEDIKDITSFLDKDIVVVVGGVKPFESNQLSQAFSVDDGTINYIFSFVPTADKKDVKNLMEESGNHTYFAPYTPDYFSYCGDDDIYTAITKIHSRVTTGQAKKAFGLFRKGERNG